MNSPSYDAEDVPQANAALTSASRRIREGTRSSSEEKPRSSASVASAASAAPVTKEKDPEYIPLHELAKGWKAAISWCSDAKTKHEARKKNDRGNLPLHSAASFRAPVEVIGEFVGGC
jgi:hypothetical protein